MVKKKYDELRIVKFLKQRGPTTPTIIGVELYGIDECNASATVSRLLKKLVAMGLVSKAAKFGHWEAS